MDAIRRGEDLANAAVAFMEAVNEFDKATSEEVEDMTRQRDRRSDTWLWLKNAIGDFRAAADQAKNKS